MGANFMNGMMLAKIYWWAQALGVVFIVVCLLLIVIVLLQKGRGGGLSAAFGGAGGQSAFGSKTGDVFTWATIVVVAVFLLLAIVLTKHYEPVYEGDARPQPAIGAPPVAAPLPTDGQADEQAPTNDMGEQEGAGMGAVDESGGGEEPAQ